VELQEPVVDEGIRNAEDLRKVLREAEIAVADLRGMGPTHVLNLLHMLDAIEEAVPRLESNLGIDLKPERTRLQTIENMLRSRASRALREVGKSQLIRHREEVGPSESAWWWYIDQLVAERRRAAIRRWALRVSVVGAILLVASLVYQIVFAPSPEERALSERLSQGETSLLQGDLETALAEFQAALAVDPNDGETCLYVGAILQQLGREQEGAEYLQRGRDLIGNPAKYHASLALVYYRMALANLDTIGMAESEALAALEADENLALAHFALASAYEVQGRVQEAIQEFERASDLSSDPSLTVLARMRMGMLMQRPIQPQGSPTAEKAE